MSAACASPKHAARPGRTPATVEVARASGEPAGRSSVESGARADEQASDDQESVQYGAPWLGVELRAVSTEQTGVLVAGVVPGSPAATAGLVPGDVILRVDTSAATTPRDVVAAVDGHHPGEPLDVAFRRGQEERRARAVLKRRPDVNDMLRSYYLNEPAPAFQELKEAQGLAPVSLAALKGQVVLVEFWATWCMPCRIMIPHMNGLHARFAAQGVTVLGVTVAPVEQAANDSRELGMLYPILSDDTGSTTRAYRALALPMLFVIDKHGVVREVLVGYDPQGMGGLEGLVVRLLHEKA